jgi:hypothetical protein
MVVDGRVGLRRREEEKEVVGTERAGAAVGMGEERREEEKARTMASISADESVASLKEAE